MKQKIIVGILALLSIISATVGVCILINSNEEEKTQKEPAKQETEKKEKTGSIVISNTRNLIYEINEDLEVIWKYEVKNETNVYNIARVDGDYIYYTDNDQLYRRNYKTNETEDLGVTLYDYWFFYVEGNTVIYDKLFEVYQVDLTTKETTKLDIQNNNQEALINGVFYYSNNLDNTISAYNLSTKENTVIEQKGRIVEYNKDNILYINANNEYILYSVKDGKKEVVLYDEYALLSGINYPIHLYENKVYTMEKNSLDVISGKKESIYTHSFGENETAFDFIFLSDTKILLTTFVEDKTVPCQDEICGPTGDYKYYIVDLNTKEFKEVDENHEINNVGAEIHYINK